MNYRQLNVHDFLITGARPLIWRSSTGFYCRGDVFELATLQFRGRDNHETRPFSCSPQHPARFGNRGQRGQRGHSSLPDHPAQGG